MSGSLIAYFRSGWAFLIPYLATYLVYAWLKWPVNHAIRGQQSAVSSQGSWAPCLLHVYWFLHALHLVLAALAVRAWWHNSGATVSGETGDQKTANGESLFHQSNESPPTVPITILRVPSLSAANRATPSEPTTAPLSDNRPPSNLDRLWPIAPWLCLGLIFWFPGAYLEFPSDPWEHFARITKWNEIMTMMHGDIGSFYKPSFYYFAYSFLEHLPVFWQLKFLDLYEASIALLVSWQFYRLALACGLTARICMTATLIQALLFGNNIFGFYRYYGLSSSAFSMLGALAVIRIGITMALHFSPRRCNQEADSADSPPSHLGTLAISLFLTLALTALNHVQGLAIAGLGGLGIVVWHGIRHYPKVAGHAFALFICSNILFVAFFPRHPLIDSLFRPQTWLNAWYGLDVLSPNTSAGIRSITILGSIGLLNVAAGIFLACRNHLVGWLTIIPLLALEFPIIALPFANYLAGVSPGAIIAFHRAIFAIPPGLALVVLCVLLSENIAGRGRPKWLLPKIPSIRLARLHKIGASLPIFILLIGCFLLMTVPSGYPHFNRAWNILSVTPDDLKMKSCLLDFYQNPTHQTTKRDLPIMVIASSGVSAALQSASPIESQFTSQERLLHGPPPRSPSSDFGRIEKSMSQSFPGNRRIDYWPPATFLFTPQSFAGVLSQHWNPTEVALAFTKN